MNVIRFFKSLRSLSEVAEDLVEDFEQIWLLWFSL